MPTPERSAIVNRLPAELVASTIISHDSEHVYLRKPAGLPVFPVATNPNSPTLLDAYAAALKDIAPQSSYADRSLHESWPKGFELGIAHRLDTNTSGLIIATKTVAALAALRSQFAAKEIRKFYLFRSSKPVGANFSQGQRVCTLPIAHHPSDKRKMVLGKAPKLGPDGKPVAASTSTNDVPHKGKWHPAYTVFHPLPATSPILPSLVPTAAAGSRLLADPLLMQSIKQHQKRQEDHQRRFLERNPDGRVKPVKFAEKAMSSIDFDHLEGYFTAEMRTGVTHQLRVHAMACGIPIAGDKLYDPETRRFGRDGGPVEQFLLHCYKMDVPGRWESPLVPVDGFRVDFGVNEADKDQ